MKKIFDFMGTFSDFMWGIPIAGLIAAVAIIITFYTKGFQFRYFGKIIKNTLGNLKDKGSGETGNFSLACRMHFHSKYNWKPAISSVLQ